MNENVDDFTKLAAARKRVLHKLDNEKMSSVNLVVISAFLSGPEADMAKSALEAAGIDAIIQADSAGGMRPHLAWASGGFKLLVREEDAV